jgi:hypothetical protein
MEERIEVVRGNLGEPARGQLVAFLRPHWRSAEEAAAAAAGAVAVLRSARGDLIGAGSVTAERIALLSGRRLWAYRAFLAPEARLDRFMPLLGATFDALAAEFAAAGSGPAGVFLAVRSRELLERHRRFVWADPAFMYAGYLPGGAQARLRWFEGATI